jgi:signal transduction histidine kinase
VPGFVCYADRSGTVRVAAPARPDGREPAREGTHLRTVLGQGWYEAHEAQIAAALEGAAFSRDVQSGRPGVQLERSISPLRQRSGGQRSGGVHGLYVLERDMTRERERTAARVVRAEHAAQRRLSGAIAHEINNPLAGIKSAFALVRDALPRASSAHTFANMVDREVDRVADIVRQVFQMHRPDPAVREDAPLAPVLEAAVGAVEREYAAADVELEVATPDPTLRATFSEAALAGALERLLRNALQSSSAGDRVQLHVVDEGCGAADEIRERIFDPFFTTRRSTGPTAHGLGLSVARSWLQSMGGTVAFTANSRGSTFTITLARTTSDAALDTGETA